MATRKGRPKRIETDQESARQSLIDAARQSFAQEGFEKVSIRKIAQVAGVDAAMIRYYFGSKAGLFEATVQETLAPVIAQFQTTIDPQVPLNPLRLMQAYYRMIAATPMLPKLIQQVLNQQDSPEAFAILSASVDNIIKRSENWIKAFTQHNQINPNLNPDWIRLSFISLMVFPILAPKYIQNKLGVEVNEDWLMALAEHNQTLLEEGLFTFSNQSPNDNNDRREP
ncbi:TetR/AcrR family transcriptional regulator [Marinomonas spartinae]|uniref:TetR/AcrR family transcriptional regulator n=1 Tax=Marinomonas spartinae TaxID=1792290 RepID=UPI0018F219B2|nr:TetR/AcrR family transcriptional regulator [Marinomonas spartinae]MBJ7553862.1 TetR/AcrR family transcriptional regulator [Marinomonas spartinae]